MTKTKIYLILGAAGSGRRQVLADLLADDIAGGGKPVLMLSEGEAASDWDNQCGAAVRWRFTEEKQIEGGYPADAEEVFFLLDGRRNPVDQLEAAREWIERAGGEIGRILCVVNCQLAEKNPELLAWFDACIHFSDVVLLNRREGVSNKWIADFRARYEKQYFPCLFEFVKDGRVKNPALVLEPQARRISQAFDEDLGGLPAGDYVFEDTTEEEEEDDEEAGKESDDEDLSPEPDPYFIRKPGGRRVREIPNIADYLQ